MEMNIATRQNAEKIPQVEIEIENVIKNMSTYIFSLLLLYILLKFLFIIIIIIIIITCNFCAGMMRCWYDEI